MCFDDEDIRKKRVGRGGTLLSFFARQDPIELIFRDCSEQQVPGGGHSHAQGLLPSGGGGGPAEGRWGDADPRQLCATHTPRVAVQQPKKKKKKKKKKEDVVIY